MKQVPKSSSLEPRWCQWKSKGTELHRAGLTLRVLVDNALSPHQHIMVGGIGKGGEGMEGGAPRPESWEPLL